MTGPIEPHPASEHAESGVSVPEDGLGATAAAVPEPKPGYAVPPLSTARPARRYHLRFALLYATLGGIFVAAVAGLVVLVVKPAAQGGGASSAWSSWRPTSGTNAAVASQIADHVAHEYKLSKGGAQLVAVVSGPPRVTSGTHKVAISHIALRKTAGSNKGIQILSSGGSWTDQFCGLGASCSIASGQASVTRGRLVRREALEVALYTFKFVPAIQSVIAFMPPPPGQTASTLLFLQKSNYAKELAQPLRQTLPLATPPLPTSPDVREAATIDRLTLPAVYSYSIQALQDNSALLVLSPIAS